MVEFRDQHFHKHLGSLERNMIYQAGFTHVIIKNFGIQFLKMVE